MGISSVTGILGAVGFVICVIGIAGAVLSSSQGRPGRNGWILAGVGLVAGLVFTIVGQGIIVVQPTEVAVVFNTLSGDLSSQPLRAGTHFIVPVLQNTTIYPIEQQQFAMAGDSQAGDRAGDNAVRGRTIDGQEVLIDVSVLYGITPENANLVHTRWQNRYQEDLFLPTVRGLVRDVVSGYRAQEIYGQGRGEMESAIQEELAVRMSEEGFTLTDLLVRDINFSEQFTQAIEQAQIAEQEAERARLRVQQIQQEAEQARAQAEGQRDAEIARAEGEAQSIILRAEAQAEALRLVSQQIAANPSLIQYQYIQNLSDNVELVLLPSNSPFLFDLASLGVAQQNFTAPQIPEVGDLTPSLIPTPEASSAGGG